MGVYLYLNMALNKDQIQKIKELLRTKLNDKLSKYVRETTSMPFLVKLMQDSEKVASYSFIHSLATTLGMSVYEKISEKHLTFSNPLLPSLKKLFIQFNPNKFSSEFFACNSC